jgi:hypothetical protein
VDSSGLVTARVSGSSTVTYTDTESNKSAGTTVTVNAVTGLSFAAPVVYNVPAAQDNVAALDLDGDGNADVAVGGAKQIGVLYGNGDGTLGAYVQLTTVQADIAVREIADLNGDGRPEIIFMDTLGRLGIIFNQGGRHFADPVFQTVGLASWLSVGDLNGDGHPDIAFSLWGNGGSGSVKILLNNGNGTFTQKSEFSLIGIVEGVCSGDVDGDGIPDLAVSFETSTVDRSGVSIYYGNGDGTFRGGPTYYIGTQNMNTPAFIDLNGDGKKDLTLCHYWGYAVAVLLNNGNGTFTLSNQYHCDGYPLMLRTADFNRDGRTDIAVANAGTSHITVFRNTGGGLYATGVEFPSGGANCRTLYVADFNKDGKPDLVVENEDSSTIAILINNGT